MMKYSELINNEEVKKALESSFILNVDGIKFYIDDQAVTSDTIEDEVKFYFDNVSYVDERDLYETYYDALEQGDRRINSAYMGMRLRFIEQQLKASEPRERHYVTATTTRERADI